VNSSQGGGSKDTWVLARDEEPGNPSGDESDVTAGAMIAEFPAAWSGQEAGPAFEDARQVHVQQQQQGRRREDPRSC
jgi:hypothetical protein